MYDTLFRFFDDRAVCGGNGKYGYIDHDGHEVIPARFSMAKSFRDGVAKVYRGTTLCAIDTSGKFVKLPPYHNDEHGGLITEHLIRTQDVSSKYGFKNNSGIVIKPIYEDVGIFDQGLCPAKINGKWGVIDKSGKFVIEPKFDEMDESFSEHLIPTRTGDKWGIIDSAGKTIVEPTYDRIYPCKNGMIVVQSGIKYGYIEATGNMVFSPQFDDASEFNATGRARVGMLKHPIESMQLP